jgi:hypothetical protein
MLAYASMVIGIAGLVITHGWLSRVLFFVEGVTFVATVWAAWRYWRYP